MKRFFLFIFAATSVFSPLLAKSSTYSDIECCPQYSCTHIFRIGADWLYWKADQSQMEIGSDVTSSGGGTVVSAATILPNFEYSSGYRVYADYLCNACWTIGVSLVHLPSCPSESVSNDPDQLTTNFVAFNISLYPILTTFNQQNVFLSDFTIKWDLDLYYLDVFVQRTLCLFRCVTLDPYLGIRGFWMKQKINMNGSAPNAQAGPVTFTGSFTEKFCGAGLVTGITASWDLTCGLSLVANFGSSLVYSSVSNEYDAFGTLDGNPLQVLNDNNHHKSHPSIDSLIGMQYLYSLCNCSAEVHLGWENHLFFHTNQFSLTTNGNLTMQGLTLGGSITF